MIAAEKVVEPKNIAMLCAKKVRKVKLGIPLSGLRSNLDTVIFGSSNLSVTLQNDAIAARESSGNICNSFETLLDITPAFAQKQMTVW